MRRFSLYLATLTTVAFLWALSAGAATISVSITTDTTTCGNNIDAACFQDGGGTNDDFNSSHTATGGTSTVLSGVGSTSVALNVTGAAAADDGGADVGQSGDRSTFRNVNIMFSLQIDVDSGFDVWEVDVAQDVLGLFALNGDGAASAVGTQDNGRADIGPFNLTVDGSAYNFSASPSFLEDNPSNGSNSSQQFTGSRNDTTILSGTGDLTVSGTIAFDMEVLSNDGCSGFICSSASGGEEAAVLFGEGSIIDQDVDDYSFWGRSAANDGYEGLFTLRVTAVPEPTTLALLVTGLIGLAYGGRRR